MRSKLLFAGAGNFKVSGRHGLIEARFWFDQILHAVGLVILLGHSEVRRLTPNPRMNTCVAGQLGFDSRGCIHVVITQSWISPPDMAARAAAIGDFFKLFIGRYTFDWSASTRNSEGFVAQQWSFRCRDSRDSDSLVSIRQDRCRTF